LKPEFGYLHNHKKKKNVTLNNEINVHLIDVQTSVWCRCNDNL